MLGKQRIITLLHKIIKTIEFKKIALSITLFLLGFLHYAFIHHSLKDNPTMRKVYPIENINSPLWNGDNFTATDIFINNIKVGMLSSLIGFFSGGILTVLILYWNGFLLANIFFIALKILPSSDVVYYLKHAPTEIFAFALFSSIGFRGFLFYKKIFYKEDADNSLLPKPLEFVLPMILLFISSIIEVL